MLKHFILIAWRNIKRRKGLSFIQIMCLSVGLAAFILITRYVQYEKDWDKFNVNYDRIYRVQNYKINDRMSDGNQVPVPVSKYLRDHIPEVENAIILREVWNEYLSADAEHIYNEQKGWLAPSDVFNIFSFKLIRGEKSSVLDKPNSIVLNETLAQKYFPGQDPLGKILLDERKRELIVTGVMKDIPEQTEFRATYFRSNKNLLRDMGENWYNHSQRAIVLLKPNTSHLTVSEKIKNVLLEHNPNAKEYIYLRPLSELHLNSAPRDDRGSVIIFYSILGILTLLLASVSFMNITTSFSTLRSVEIGVRKVSGSNTNYIRWQFLSEAIFLALLSFLFAIFIAHLILPFFNIVVNRSIEIQLLKNPMFLLFLIAITVITGAIAGLYPALIVSSFKPVKVLKRSIPFKKGKITGLNAMVYFQFILSVVLITSSLWMFRQVNFLRNRDLGFKKQHLLHCRIPDMNTDVKYSYLRERILAKPGIEEMSISYNSPLHSTWGTGILYEGGPQNDYVSGRWNRACESFINTMDMEIVEGRNFSKEFSTDNNSCLINETAVKAFGWQNPIGKWVDSGGKHVVVGVIKDFNSDDVHNPVLPYVLKLHQGNLDTNNDLNFKINPATTNESLEHINSVMAELFPNVLFDVNGYDVGTYRVALNIWTNVKDTFAFFTVMAVLIAALGLFGLVVFASQRKVKEIGVRKVHGARTEQILPLITKQFIVLVLAANLIVLPLARFLEKVIPGQFKYHFTVYDLAIVLGITIVVIIVSSGYQAIKASMLNPVEALRYE